MGARLRRLRKDYKGKKLDDGRLLSGQGRLTDKKIDSLQNYYGQAIRRNCENLDNMRRDVWAIFFHTISTDDCPQHGLCPKGETSWCPYNRSLVTGEVYSHKHSLPASVGDIIKPVFRSLADSELLRKCLHGRTQNPNESFNSVIWSKIPKIVFVSIDTLSVRVHDSVLTFNEGCAGRVKVLKCLGIKPGVNMLKICREIDLLRLKKSDLDGENFNKEARKAARNKKRSREDTEDSDDPEYGPGLH